MKIVIGFVVAILIIAILVFDIPESERPMTMNERDVEMLRDYQIETSQEIEREELLLERQMENLRLDEERYQERIDDALH